MPDPVNITLTVSVIDSLVFQEFIKSGTGELTNKFTVFNGIVNLTGCVQN